MIDSRELAGDLGAEGSVVGPYRLVRVIGRGGMGVVFEAVHERAGQRAAVKLLAMERRTEGAAQVVRRFLNEARALSRVSHPGLVRLFDCGETASGAPWIAMELVRGQVLRARIDERAAEGHGLPIAESVRVIRQLASAVGALHRAGVVHRDLKPENVMIVADEEAPFGERVKLLDFGIAKLSGEGDTVTTEGVVLGTAGYMSPEQCAGAPGIDAQADVYALGVMLFELCTGTRPFRGDAVSVMRKHLFAEPPVIEQIAPKLPRGLGALVRVMLAKEPSLRPGIDTVVDRLRGIESIPSIAPAAAPDPEDTIPPTKAAFRPLNTAPAEPIETGPATVPESEQDRRGPATVPESEQDRRGPAQRSVKSLAPQAIANEAAPQAPVKSPEEADAPPRATAQLAPSRPRRTLAIIALVAAGIGALAGVWQMRSRERAQPAVTLLGMVRVEGGTFRMGSADAEIEAACATLAGGCTPEEMPQIQREKPAHDVTVSPFQIDEREVTNKEYALFLGAMKESLLVRDDADDHYPRFVTVRATSTLLFDLYPPASGIVRSKDGQFSAKPGWESRPMTLVTWDGAALYCRHQGKRLPTEAEWERAARGANGRRFPWGNEPPRCDGVVFGRGDARGCPDLAGEIADAGAASQDVTPEGVRGMAGNVGEWVQDAFVLPYYPDCGDCRDPVVEQPDAGADDQRVFRGGTLYGNAWFVRTTTRSRWKRTSVMNGLGLRCATR